RRSTVSPHRSHRSHSPIPPIMKKLEKAQKIAEILDRLYPLPPIPLTHEDPFTLLVAVLLSAQTTDAQVNKVTPALFRLAKTPRAMAQLTVDQILGAIRSCGLAPGKARNIKRLSEILVEEHGGNFPADTHIHRLAHRWKLSNGKSVEQTERDLKRLFPPESWGRRHLQIIYFGREHCPARGHEASACPICSWI